ncbi:MULTISPECIES: FecCD family ABC transporter permease [Actinoalloteichus]|uniref:ABC-type Fe3+-siderophore transport system, permease component n=1 Tax=Actinoalloteichus fjordicus TaxID=1612552 RepID=A0AAC9PRY6_9PSEU|nr:MULTISPECIES: iron ABC transporter permease [Actinoalloteichus]APU14944.1 ABC-type Fe3+-siderophore transport system, permease component [Actinoalloteichus fjordicus]APU21014.1 ABC-type Fe3+-siderophore transport system, permease component [Actinoalloteichus sp. GBA129-24]
MASVSPSSSASVTSSSATNPSTTSAPTASAPPPRRGGVRGGGTRRYLLLLCAGLVLLACTVLASLVFGSRVTTPADVLSVFDGTADPYLTTVIESRYPRTLLGVLAGAGLAVAGTLLQAITRNPLAEPGLLGINMGAAAGIVTATMFLGARAAVTTVWWALPGAILAGLLVYAIGAAGPASGLVRLVLAGAVVSAVLGAYIQAVTLSLPEVFDGHRHWVVGSLAGRDLDVVLMILPFMLVGMALALLLGPALNALALGDETASSLGVNATLIRAGGLASAVLLSAAATAAAGPIAFIGLAVPHIGRALVGIDFRRQIPCALLLGPTMLLAADVVGRVLLRPQELLVGVVAAFAGAPFLLLAVRRMKGGAS